MRNKTGKIFGYLTVIGMIIVAESPSVAFAQSCEELCRTDPTYKIMNQQACLQAALTGSCTSGNVQPRPDNDMEIIARDRPYYESLGLPGDFGGLPPAERKDIAADRAQILLERQKQHLAQMNSLAEVRPQSYEEERILRENFAMAQQAYDEINRELQELRRAYEGSFRR